MDYNQICEDYNLLYSSKDYKEECDFIIEKTQDKNLLLDIGCGTGIHASLLSQSGKSVVGIDISEGMIEQAKANNQESDHLSFENISLRDHVREKPYFFKYDAVISMFNVINHMHNIDTLDMFFKDISKILSNNGILIFDCWNSIACAIEKPYESYEKKVKEKTIFYKTSINLFESVCKTMIQYENNLVELETTIWSPKILKELMKKRGILVEEILNFRNLKKQATEKDHRILFLCRKQ